MGLIRADQPEAGSRSSLPGYGVASTRSICVDSLPLSGRAESILRFDHMQPIGKHGESYDLTEFALHDDALALVDEYLMWFLMGGFPADGIMNDFREGLGGLDS